MLKEKTVVLYRKISKEYIKLIREGDFARDRRFPSKNDIIKKYDVSQVTALKVLKELANMGYIYKVTGKGYFLSDNIDTYGQRKRTGIIACLLRTIRAYSSFDNYFNEIISGINLECARHRCKMLLFPDCCDPLSFTTSYEFAAESVTGSVEPVKDMVDGFIIDEKIPDSIIEKILEWDKSVVLLNRDSKLKNISRIVPDNAKAASEAARLSIKAGCDCFIIAYSGGVPNQDERFQTFISTLKSAGIKEDRIFKTSKFLIEDKLADVKTFYRRIKDKWPESTPVLFTASDYFAKNLFDPLLKLGIKIPGDMKMVSIGGLIGVQNMSPAITTFRIDTEAMGRKTVRVLIENINLDTRPARHNSPVSLIMGETL